MPRLSSGRHVGVTIDWIRKALGRVTNEQALAIIVDYRLRVREASDLRSFGRVFYLDAPPGGIAEPQARYSGHLVRDIEAGRADWSPDEIREFLEWVARDQTFNVGVEAEFGLTHVAITSHPLWTSSLMLGDP
jgi:hypothetical protein